VVSRGPVFVGVCNAGRVRFDSGRTDSELDNGMIERLIIGIGTLAAVSRDEAAATLTGILIDEDPWYAGGGGSVIIRAC